MVAVYSAMPYSLKTGHIRLIRQRGYPHPRSEATDTHFLYPHFPGSLPRSAVSCDD
jgi:hypothetical protein